jgi:hypothetical protein
MLSISGYQIVKEIPLRAEGFWPWRKLTCAVCGEKAQKQAFNIPRHLARELLELGWLGAEDEQRFKATRDDLGWQLRGWVCPHCKHFAPERLAHTR